jgi:sugar phosphate isomerase/epimerase
MRKVLSPLLIALLMTTACNNSTKNDIRIFEKDNLIAWCIVPFDANDRSPAERAQMLKDLGINKLAYDYRDRHIPQFEEEINTLSKEGIELSSVWLWIQDTDDNLLDPASESIVSIVEKTGVKTAFWISFPDEFFEGLSDDEKMTKSVHTITALNNRLQKSGCSIALYNHGNWFGNPLNQIEIIKAIGSDNIGIVYNFHHAHHEIDRFPELFPKMLPYLTAVNINGMRKEGPMIITLGEGDKELGMLRVMVESGYDGPVGIIGHTEGEDIKLVLERNLKGLEKLKKALSS